MSENWDMRMGQVARLTYLRGECQKILNRIGGWECEAFVHDDIIRPTTASAFDALAKWRWSVPSSGDQGMLAHEVARAMRAWWA